MLVLKVKEDEEKLEKALENLKIEEKILKVKIQDIL